MDLKLGLGLVPRDDGEGLLGRGHLGLPVQHGGAEGDLGISVGGDLVDRLHGVESGGGDMLIPGIDADISALPEEQVAVDARPRIPAGGGVQSAGGDLQMVLLPRADMVGQIHQHRGIAVGMLDEDVVVEFDLGIHVSAVHVQDVVAGGGVKLHILVIVTVPADEIAVVSAAGGVGIAGSGDGVVVGQIHLTVEMGGVERPALGEESLFHGDAHPFMHKISDRGGGAPPNEPKNKVLTVFGERGGETSPLRITMNQ